jgi:dienelactone hydrolase
MRITPHIVAAALLVLTIFVFPRTGPLAAEQVQFSSASVPPTPFKVKQAKKKGIELKAEPGIPLIGWLSKPPGPGPFPAVVLFHGCFGIRTYQDAWAAQLSAWGYVTLQVDYFTPRGVEQTCADLRYAFLRGYGGENVTDAYGALSYLSGLPFVAKKRIALIGWGDSPVLRSIVRGGQERNFDLKFSAAVALYPPCKKMDGGDFYAPLLILVGAKDDWRPATFCQDMAEMSRVHAVPVSLKVYSDAYHAFDDSAVGERWYFEDAQNLLKMPTRGATLGYSPAAHEDALKMVRTFLSEHLQ